MSIADIARRVLPASTVASITRAKKKLHRARIERLPQLTEEEFTNILVNDLGLTRGDTVFIHSSIDKLNLGFPFYRILTLVRDVTGTSGTILFPTYPNHRISSYEYLLQGNVFDVRRTPSYIGLLTEVARRQRGAVRSLHPTKSVSAIGPLARELTGEHQNSPYPYDKSSPYYKLVECEGKIVGLGVWTSNISFGYCVEDALKERFPARTYHERLFEATCINYQGEQEIVRTYAHNMKVVNQHDGPGFMRAHVSPEACQDLTIKGMKFFRASAPKLFNEMLSLALQGITAYPRSTYTKEFLEKQKSKANASQSA
jgi:aminoglycoside 3-N-acetyltransferase